MVSSSHARAVGSFIQGVDRPGLSFAKRRSMRPSSLSV